MVGQCDVILIGAIKSFNFTTKQNMSLKKFKLSFKFFLFFSEAKDVFALLKGDKLKPGEEPTFTWFKSGQEFDPDDRFKVRFVLDSLFC